MNEVVDTVPDISPRVSGAVSPCIYSGFIFCMAINILEGLTLGRIGLMWFNKLVRCMCLLYRPTG